jgi:hypothetical protein
MSVAQLKAEYDPVTKMRPELNSRVDTKLELQRGPVMFLLSPSSHQVGR